MYWHPAYDITQHACLLTAYYVQAGIAAVHAGHGSLPSVTALCKHQPFCQAFSSQKSRSSQSDLYRMISASHTLYLCSAPSSKLACITLLKCSCCWAEDFMLTYYTDLHWDNHFRWNERSGQNCGSLLVRSSHHSSCLDFCATKVIKLVASGRENLEYLMCTEIEHLS